VADHRGRTIHLGIRPEDVLLAPAGPSVMLDAKVEVVEPLGNEMLVHCATQAGTFICRLPGQKAPPVEAPVQLHFAFDKLHLFDSETEKALDGALEQVSAKG
jgi:multiple sugar transport system ATP-binding protein